MKYICLGYMDEKVWDKMSEEERHTFMDACFAYDDELCKKGHFVGGEALQGPRSAVTIHPGNGKVHLTDGPYAETKEQIGGIMTLEAVDLNHAIHLISKHPSLRMGGCCWEIRPSADLTAMVDESEQRRDTNKKP